MGPASMSAPTRLFVYGTLLSGERSHRRLRGSRFLGVACTEPRYTLVSLGPYPALVEGGAISVMGELYEVPGRLLPALDLFEGHPDLYRRRDIRLLREVDAEAYLLVPTQEHAEVIESGDWRQHTGQSRR
jgi:gamma-glutamylaminecyclotransferase